MFVILWEFEVKQVSKESFEKVYGPEGAWVQLFRRDPHYSATRLLRDTSRPNVYFTLDYWNTGKDYSNFRNAHVAAYEALDRASEGLTLRERYVGSFAQSEPDHSNA